MTSKIAKLLPLISALVLLISCDSKKSEYDPYSLSEKQNTEQSQTSFEVAFKKTDTNLKTIYIKLNDSNGFDALFDTGCSDMLISELELQNLLKAGTISESDRMVAQGAIYADGSINYNPRYKIREVTIVDKNGKPHTVKDVIATVVENQVANVLIGSTVIDNLAKKSYTVNLRNRTIRFD